MLQKSRFKGWTGLFVGLIGVAFMVVFLAKPVMGQGEVGDNCNQNHPVGGEDGFPVEGLGCSKSEARKDWKRQARDIVCITVCDIADDCGEGICSPKNFRRTRIECFRTTADPTPICPEHWKCEARVTNCRCRCR
ncbi:MAG: hypothetical protein ACUZ77_00390 [Candidatus Brocadiales bacterium]